VNSRPATAQGEILDKTYRLVRLVAEGGMGLVYEATHARLAGRYAIKVLPPEWSKDPAAMARFDREARITSSLQHPNIVQIIDFNTAADGTEYLVMEFLQGETLAARLARLGPMSVDTVIAIVEQVASGLAAAHAHGIVHRDLKPENVLLMQVEGREGDWVKILDFGISKLTGAGGDTIAPTTESLIGTPLYMAPEQCEGRMKDVDAATDQFALAVMTYEMLTGRPPFAGESIGEVLFRVLHAEPPPMNINRGVESAVRRGLAKSSRRRYPSVTAFAEGLRAAALSHGPRLVRNGTEESGSHGYAVGEIERTTFEAPARRRPWAAGLVAAAAITAATVFMVRTERLTVPALATATVPGPEGVVPATTAAVPQGSPAPVAEIEPPKESPPSAAADSRAPDIASSALDEVAASELTNEAEPARAAVPRPARAARAAVPRPARTPVLPAVRASAPRPVARVAWTPSQRPSTRVAVTRPREALPARELALGAQLSGPAHRRTGQGATFQPPPFRPLPADDDAVLPLSEP
jgi:hypothetical protein